MSANSFTVRVFLLMNFYNGVAIVALVISLVSAIGVYLAPLIHDKVKRSRDSREIHKRELTVHVLKPLIRQINYFLRQEIAIRQDQSFEKIPSDMVDKYANRNFDFVGIEPIFISFKGLGENNDGWFDENLFNDLKNHYSKLNEDVNHTRGILTTYMRTYVRKRWELINDLYDILSPKFKDPYNGPHDLGNMVTVALMRLLFYEQQQWQALYDKIKNIPDFDKAIEVIMSDDDFKTKADEISKIQKTVVDSLLNLRNNINREATSGAKLEGNCNYLGKNHS
jgi:hypothetical protein